MGDPKQKAEITQKLQPPPPSQQHLSTPPSDHHDPDQESTDQTVVSGAPFVPSAVFVPASGSFEKQQQQFEAVNPKRPRYTASQWKLLPSPSSHQQKQSQLNALTTDSSSSPSAAHQTPNPQPQAPLPPTHTAASSTDTASSPSHSPRPSHSAGQETNKPEGAEKFQQQFRKGKYVSPVWKPNEMLWLARAWRIQYQGGGSGAAPPDVAGFFMEAAGGGGGELGAGRGKSRADKDKEVAEFLNRHGVNRDAKTAGTKWDNMLGEFRKVYEWEKSGEREQTGKSYFRLSQYERKIHRLPASFDEQVFEELAQFMGPRMRNPHGRSSSAFVPGVESPFIPPKSLPPPPPFRDDELHFSARTKQLGASGGGDSYFHGTRSGLLGFEGYGTDTGPSSSSSSFKELRRIGKVKMIWEESVSLWSEEGEHHRGRVKLQGSSFLNADELAFLDDSMVACAMEYFEDGHLRGFSVDRFVSGQAVKVFGRKSSSNQTLPGVNERFQLSSVEPSIRSVTTLEYQDPTEYYAGCLRVPPSTLPNLFELSWHLQEPPSEELRFPLRKDVYRELPQGKELFFTTSTELLDCRLVAFEILSPIMRSNPGLSASTGTSRDSFIALWDDCINRIISKFCSIEMVFVRKSSSSSSLADAIQDQWPNLTAFLRNFCLWRGEEVDQLREGGIDPSNSIIEKLLWTYLDLPYILGYYAVGYLVTFCALSRSQDRILRTDLCTIDLSSATDRMKALVPCWRIAGLLPLLADRCFNYVTSDCNYKNFPYSDFERIDLGNGSILEMTPNYVIRIFSSKRKWIAVKEIYDFLDGRIPHAEFIVRSSEKDLSLMFKPRGCKFKPANCDQLVEALKDVTKALVALHDLSFMHRDLSWEKVMIRSDRENEWLLTGFDEAVSAPQIYPHGGAAAGGGRHAPEMARGLHGVKVDVWGVGHLVKSCGLVGIPKLLKELQNRCLEHNPEQRPTAADCYHHLLQLQSSILSAATAGGGY